MTINTLNPQLTPEDFKNDQIIRITDRMGFKGQPLVVTLPGGFKLYKLTADQAPQSATRHVVSAWWSAVDPYLLDTEGAAGRFVQAQMNGIDMSSMVRFMSAVKIEWNSLTKYVEISIKKDCRIRCFWGTFAPMKLSDDNTDSRIIQYGATTSSALGYSAAVLPEDLGSLTAWQFYIPNLTDNYIEGGANGRKVVDAHDMKALAKHFGIDSARARSYRPSSKP